MSTKNKGFTLIEIIIFIVVFTVGVMGIMILFYNTLGKTSDPIIRHKAIVAAQTVLEEIISKKFDEDTLNGGGTINLDKINIGNENNENSMNKYDDVDDYVDSCDTEKEYQPSDFGLNGNYKIFVNVHFVKIENGKIVSNSCTATNYKLIQVSVESDLLKERYTLEYVKGNF
ncbi:conserved hypothetical protein [Deferribacter desulfuricans SSM1]|uniref:MSHA pilin protein MshD n=1 Tax=Deferribacter desulfuricans (strain DSM 14783 / JCM 11476 / NBRC 101012 / SSM1) TaxID=639282 RepID=D3PDP2_DEFDS|nr:prepilin-type N-terminal cleavage/methylation domain-containing protein [Deferribacter desulfuricans]BAI80715.1 conserved hypothetical protein [Deferribacter desulfuricans SSM1]